ncbi:Hvo_1808 family surface protein [Halobium salinum]|uniref:Hvo_1808 family surface protein n=1 Tax=Halobium salinum TaxID=1364940 RepID=A0ABD5PAH7_9EURY|nr:Hvo_1808 family surface protein [Halobium salinum]
MRALAALLVAVFVVAGGGAAWLVDAGAAPVAPSAVDGGRDAGSASTPTPGVAPDRPDPTPTVGPAPSHGRPAAGDGRSSDDAGVGSPEGTGGDVDGPAADNGAPSTGRNDDRRGNGGIGSPTDVTEGVDGADGADAGAGADPVDALGWEAGYRYDDVLDVDGRDGLSPAELDAVVARTMARIEHLRGLEFEEPVTVEVVSREQHLREGFGNASGSGGDEPPATDHLNEQVWEALFVVGEDANVDDEFATLYGSNVLGYYAPAEKRLVLITEDPERAVVDPHTLAHELTHALQDQHFDLAASAASVRTQDTQLARNGLIEGEANYLAERYMAECAAGWDCLDRPRNRGSSNDDVNLPMLFVVYQPYSDGPTYVDALVDAGGWDAVDAAHATLPASTEQVIYPGVDETPGVVPVPETARDGWTRVGDPAGDTVGEASIYVMFWNAARTTGADVVDTRAFVIPDGVAGLDVYNYSAPVSDGWANDRLVAYGRSGDGADAGGTGADGADGNGSDRTGAVGAYVWVTEWDSHADAREFYDGYRALLVGHGAEQVSLNTWVVPSGPYADAFRVTLDGTRVVVVNAPAVEDLDDVYSPVRAAATAGSDGRTGVGP